MNSEAVEAEVRSAGTVDAQSNTVRIRIDCAYDGTDFHGWARQLHLRTVQGEIEAAISKILHIHPERGDQPVRLVVAGRTDTGVHAREQVCHADIPVCELQRAIGHLPFDAVTSLGHRLPFVVPDDIVVRKVSLAPAGFDARFSALERTYTYRICDNPESDDPLVRRFVLRLSRPLDIHVLNQCARLIPGLKDFGSFATPNVGGTTIREVHHALWTRIPARRGQFGQRNVESGLLTFTIVADAFAHNMVRSLVGAQVAVGEGKKTVEWFADKLAHPEREGLTGPIEAKGLCMEHIAYPADDQLAARAQKIRAKRSSDEIK
jgi:tRNA pseudouridine38-40 synthase